MQTLKKTSSAFFMTMILGLGLSSCHESVSPVSPGNYNPLSRKSATYYLNESMNISTGEPFQSDTIKVYFLKDTTIGTQKYEAYNYSYNWQSTEGTVVNTDFFRFLRNDNSRHYYLPFTADVTEYLAFDSKLNVNSSWTYLSGFENESKEIFTIKSVDIDKVVNGITYHHVIEVWQEISYKGLDGQYLAVMKIITFIARDEGEIYYYSESYSYPSGLRRSIIKK